MPFEALAKKDSVSVFLFRIFPPIQADFLFGNKKVLREAGP
jgi:hypothetical protein